MASHSFSPCSFSPTTHKFEAVVYQDKVPAGIKGRLDLAISKKLVKGTGYTSFEIGRPDAPEIIGKAIVDSLGSVVK